MWQRVAYVLVTAAAPRLAKTAAFSGVPGLDWFRVLHEHETRGMTMVEEAGGPSTITRLVGASPAGLAEEFRSLLLRAVDDAC